MMDPAADNVIELRHRTPQERSEYLISRAIMLLSMMSDVDRLIVFDTFCVECGGADPDCACGEMKGKWADE